ncbi:MAG: DUF697 domain-containing protein [Haliscomenobacter sp.]
MRKTIQKLAIETIKKKAMSEFSGGTDKSNHADTVIRNHVVWSMGAGFIPVIIADVFAVTALQLDMIRQLCRVYGVDFAETQGKAIVTSLTSATIARITASSVTKMIPVVGSMLGGVTVSVFAGASTYALGQVFKKHFEMGGTILDFDTARLKKLYQEQFEKGRKIVEDLARQSKDQSGVSDPIVVDIQPQAPAAEPQETVQTPDIRTDVVAQLKELAALKAQGVLTEEEFAQMKRKLIAG